MWKKKDILLQNFVKSQVDMSRYNQVDKTVEAKEKSTSNEADFSHFSFGF